MLQEKAQKERKVCQDKLKMDGGLANKGSGRTAITYRIEDYGFV